MMLVHRRPVAGGLGVGLAHIRAFLRVPVIVRACEMVDVRRSGGTFAVRRTMVPASPSTGAPDKLGRASH